MEDCEVLIRVPTVAVVINAAMEGLRAMDPKGTVSWTYWRMCWSRRIGLCIVG